MPLKNKNRKAQQNSLLQFLAQVTEALLTGSLGMSCTTDSIFVFHGSLSFHTMELVSLNFFTFATSRSLIQLKYVLREEAAHSVCFEAAIC